MSIDPKELSSAVREALGIDENGRAIGVEADDAVQAALERVSKLEEAAGGTPLDELPDGVLRQYERLLNEATYSRGGSLEADARRDALGRAAEARENEAKARRARLAREEERSQDEAAGSSWDPKAWAQAVFGRSGAS
jgi:hypothetical protein